MFDKLKKKMTLSKSESKALLITEFIEGSKDQGFGGCMSRKEAIQYISILLGGNLAGANNFISGCKTADKKLFFKRRSDIPQ